MHADGPDVVRISSTLKGLLLHVSDGSRTSQHAPRLSRRRRITILASAILLMGTIGAMWLVFAREEPSGHTDSITVAIPATGGPPQSTESDIITHVTLTGGEPGNVGLNVRLTDMKGGALPAETGHTMTVDLTSLNHGIEVSDIALEPVANASTPTFTWNDADIPEEGWWRIRTTISQPEGSSLVSDFYIILPDPNMRGFNAPEEPVSDQEAADTLNAAITDMGGWVSLRWWEWLSGGNDSMLISRFSVTTPDANNAPDSFMSESLFAGGFEPRADGSQITPPQINYLTSITIGDRAWAVDSEDIVTERSPTMYLPIERYPETYAEAEHIRYGIREDVNGEPSQTITFHVPDQPVQAEAWYTFWIGMESGRIHRIAMVTNNHYMVREYFDINEPFVIEPPEGVKPPQATPAATPVA